MDLKISAVRLSDQDREALRRRARDNALARGIKPKEWERWRASRPVAKDLLMAFDPEMECQLIREARRPLRLSSASG